MTVTAPFGVVEEPGIFSVKQRPALDTAPDGWVLVDICAVGLCGTDYHIFEGKHPFLEYPRVIGHELSGRIAVASGEWQTGDLVVINPYLACGTCHSCRRDKPNCCENIEVLGVHRDGGLTRRIVVPSGNLIAATGLTAHQAAMVEFLAIGAHAVQRSGMTGADKVLVTGAGPIGIGAALFARLMQADVVLLDRDPKRLAMARDRFGFDESFTSVADALDNNHGYDVVFDATGHKGAIEAGFPLIAHGGSYVLVSVVTDDISFSDPEFHKREMRLIGSRNALSQDFAWVMRAIREGTIDTGGLCSQVITLPDLPNRFSDLAADRGGIIKVIIDLEAGSVVPDPRDQDR